MEGATVLVVDDDAAIREVVGQLLEDEGYQPMLVAGGAEAIERLDASNPPDAMLLDLLMPGVDGYGVLEHLRGNLLQEFPVLIFSAQKPDERVLQALDSELRDFIAKPFDPDELLIRLKRLLQRSPRGAAGASEQLRIYALGSLRVFRDEKLLFDEGWRNKPAKTIFKMLFTQRGRRFPKDVIAEELWPEADPDAAANRLRVAIHELRKMLGEGKRSEGGTSCIAQQEGAYFFDEAAGYWTDVDAFEGLVEQGRVLAADGRLDEALHAYQSAEALYQGDYLRDDLFFEWTVPTRERLREEHLDILSAAAGIYAARGEPERAVSFCRKIVRLEPWREEVYRHLMAYLVKAARPHEALRVFEECRRALQAEVDAMPSAETVRLRDQILAGAAGGE